ncbi:MAG: ABC transporter permease [Candidatus Saganbacteria bacterium]|nr:ABC transporter permease [Candidatus Saganbacteria bacterium]
MRKFIIRRLLQLIPLLIGISLISFFVMHLAPGDPTQLFIDPSVKPEELARIRANWGLDQPIIVQYFIWLKNALKGDFGIAYLINRPVLDVIFERLPVTLLLMVSSFIITLFITIPLGVISADPLIRDQGLGIRVLDVMKHMILPLLTMTVVSLAGLTRYQRAAMLEVLNQDFIRTARAKGLPERLVIFKHALRNALIPIVTILGLSLPDLFGGAFIIETVFAWPGMGRLGVMAIFSRNYPLIMGIVIISAALIVLGNLLADIGYALVDPRIRYEKK